MPSLPFIGLLLLLLGPGNETATHKGKTVRDFDKPFFAAAKTNLQRVDAEAGSRIRAMQELVARNAPEARELIAGALQDRTFAVRREAAEWLARYRDPRGLSWEAECLESAECTDIRHHAVRILGSSGDPRYAPPIRKHVRRILESGLRDGSWDGSAADRAMLKYGAIALARMGLIEDRELVLSIVRARPNGDSAFLEALGYVDDPRAREILWSAYGTQTGAAASCNEPRLGVSALLPLSRLGEERAIQTLKDILRGIGTPRDPWEGTFPSLCVDRAQAFERLRPRDARNFAQTILEIAGREPEGPGTFAAWNALGLMRPAGYGPRVLKLAVSKPNWPLVSHHMLNTVVLALDPDLHDEFWGSYEKVQEVPAQTGMRAQVKEGLGYLLFSGSSTWTGD